MVAGNVLEGVVPRFSSIIHCDIVTTMCLVNIDVTLCGGARNMIHGGMLGKSADGRPTFSPM